MSAGDRLAGSKEWKENLGITVRGYMNQSEAGERDVEVEVGMGNIGAGWKMTHDPTQRTDTPPISRTTTTHFCLFMSQWKVQEPQCSVLAGTYNSVMWWEVLNTGLKSYSRLNNCKVFAVATPSTWETHFWMSVWVTHVVEMILFGVYFFGNAIFKLQKLLITHRRHYILSLFLAQIKWQPSLYLFFLIWCATHERLQPVTTHLTAMSMSI